jgi:hypothetical protein
MSWFFRSLRAFSPIVSIALLMLCYTGTFGVNVDVSDSPAKTDPLLGMSFIKSFSSVTFNLTDNTLDLVVKE